MDWPYGSPPSLIVLYSLLFVIFLGHQLMVVIYFLKCRPNYGTRSRYFTEEVTPMLAERLNCAIKVYESQKHSPYMLVSGGQGPDEPITEALAMKRYLIAKGVPEKRILMEEQSTNTYTNFQYSKPIIEGHFGRRAQFLCVTSQFHILRSLRLANKVGLEFYGLGSHTPYHFQYSAYQRFLGLMYQYKVILTIYFAIIFWVSLIRMIIV